MVTIEDIFNKMNFLERGVLFKYINDESHAKMLKIAEEIDDCIVAMLIEKFPEMTYKEISELADVISILREEQEKKIELFKNKTDKEIDKMSKDIADRSVELVIEGKNQNAALKILSKEFPQMPRATLVKAYKLSKENVKTTIDESVTESVVTAETDDELKALVDYILEEPAPVKEEKLTKFKINTISITGEHDKYVVDVTNKTINGLDVTEYSHKTYDEIGKLNKEIEILMKHKQELEMQVKEIKEVESEFLV